MDEQRKAYVFAMISVLLWSTVASAFKLSLRYLDFVSLLLFSSFVASAILFAILAVKGRLGELKRQRTKDILNSALLGFLNPFLYYLVLFKAYDILRAQEALALNYTWAVVIAVLSIPLLKQKIKFVNIAALLVSFFGAIIIATGGEPFSLRFSDELGVSLALGSSLIWALFWIFNVKDKRKETLKLFLNFSFGFVFTLIFSLFFIRFEMPPVQGIFGSLYVGAFEMGVTFVFWLLALKYSRTTAQVGNLIYLSPFLSLLFINLFVGEEIALSTIGGLVFIVGGIVLQKIGG